MKSYLRPVSFEDVPPGRRRIMRAVRSSETKPEAIVRARLHRLGFRFRKNVRTLPGKPDIVFVSRRKAIFVHGCFWHQHSSCGKITQSKVRTDYWRPKLARNTDACGARANPSQDEVRTCGRAVRNLNRFSLKL